MPGHAGSVAAKAMPRWPRLPGLSLARSLSPRSATGISLLLGCCAAAWFTAGTRPDNIKAAVALGACYLVAVAAGQLTARPAAAGLAADASGQRNELAARRAQRFAGRADAAGATGWLALLSARACEAVVYGGLAIGASAAGWGGGVWVLAIAVLSMVAVHDLMDACSSPAAIGQGNGIVHRLVGYALGMPAGGRVLLIVVIAPVWGGRAAFLALLDWAIISVGYGIGGRRSAVAGDEQPAGYFARPSAAHPSAAHPAAAHPAAAHPAAAQLAAAHPAAAQLAALQPPAHEPGPPDAGGIDMLLRLTKAERPLVTLRPAPADPAGVDAGDALPPAPDTPGVATLRNPTRPLRLSAPSHAVGPRDGAVGPRDGAVGSGDGAVGPQGMTAAPHDGDGPIDMAALHSAAVPDAGGPREPAGPLGVSAPREPAGPLGVSAPHEATGPLGIATLQEAAATGPLGIATSPEVTGPIEVTSLTGEPGSGDAGPDHAAVTLVVRCRDDGVIARQLGMLARGLLVPLPPAVIGLAAGGALALLGLRNLPGIVAIAPVVALLLAAPGSSHPHAGRFDWLVPAVLLGAQYLYIAALGFAAQVPPEVILVLCAVVMLRSPGLASGPAAERLPRLGWEGRMIVVWLGAVAGIATFAYILLAAYLGFLICRQVMTTCLALREGECR